MHYSIVIVHVVID